MIARLAYESEKILQYYEQNIDVLNQPIEQLILCCAKNDSVAFQVLLGDFSDIYGVSVDNEPFFLAAGAYETYRLQTKVTGLNVSIKQELIGYVEDNDNIKKADILLNDGSIFVSDRKQMTAVMVTISIPCDFVAGEYAGEVKLFARTRTQAERQVVTLPFSFCVYDYVAPDLKTSNFCLDLWQHYSNIARKHETRLWSDSHFAIIENYIKSLAELGQKSITVVASDAPWNGQNPEYSREYLSDFFEYSIFEVSREANGDILVDFSHCKRLLNLCFSYGIKDEIQVFGLLSVWQNSVSPWEECSSHVVGARVRYFDRKTETFKYLSDEADITKYIKSLYDFFQDEGLLDIVRISADEPHNIDDYKKQMKFYKENFPKFKFKTSFSSAKIACELEEYSQDRAVLLPELVGDIIKLKNGKKQDGKLLFYTCGLPANPNTFIRSPLLESRILPILSELLGLDGYLRWSFTAWPQYPRQRIAYRWWAGDTCLVYPSYGGNALKSLRYHNLRKGLQDVMLLKNAPQKARENFFNTIFPLHPLTNYTHPTPNQPTPLNQPTTPNYTQSPQTFAQAHQNLLISLSQK